MEVKWCVFLLIINSLFLFVEAVEANVQDIQGVRAQAHAREYMRTRARIYARAAAERRGRYFLSAPPKKKMAFSLFSSHRFPFKIPLASFSSEKLEKGALFPIFACFTCQNRRAENFSAIFSSILLVVVDLCSIFALAIGKQGMLAVMHTPFSV